MLLPPALITACPKCHTAYVDGESVCRVCYTRRSYSRSALSSKTVLTRVTLFAIGIVVAACVYLHFQIVRSEAYEDSLTRAVASPSVRDKLGDRIQVNYPVFGHLIPFGNSRFMEWSVRLTGSRGHGHLYGVANQINGIWYFSRLTFEDNNKNTTDLTPVSQVPVPPVPTKHVYLVPLGLIEGESLDWAPVYYKSKFAVEATVLPPVPLDPELIDRTREQVIAEKSIEFVQRKYPQLAADPSALLIAVTSSDMYIRSLSWSYAENFRTQGRFALISSARLHPPTLMERLNPEWLNSRLQKLLTKNLAILYFDLPMSSDYTSLLSGGVLSGLEIDQMGGGIVGAEGRWDPFVESGDPAIAIYDVPGKKPLWKRTYVRAALPDTAAQVFCADLGIGLFFQLKTDFLFEDDRALQFLRLYRTQDDRSRAFGIGGTHSFDMFIVGQMGVAVDLVLNDGARVHFVHQPPAAGQRGDVYRVTEDTDERFVNTQAIFLQNTWQIKTTDGWTYFFPYRPNALPQYVTVLTSFIDPSQHKYEMERDAFGALLRVSSPTGKWLHFENDSEHRIRRITASTGRSIQYDYDEDGHLIRATDSDGHVDSYTYDDKGQMLTAAHGEEKPLVVNEYFNDGYIKQQDMGDGRGFKYFYFRETNRIRQNYIVDPNGLETYIQYVPGGYLQSLPARPPH
jgi:YD repeat-containing protein